MREVIYLACPYTHKDSTVRDRRVQSVTKLGAKLMAQGKYVFSPLTHCHPMAMLEKLPTDWAFWEGYDRTMLECCTKLMVLKEEGWETSVGVIAETKIAQELGLPVEYVEPEA